ncbi:MAG TPA: SIMPL domain-containing protein [Blastocatellia bacterium]|jgi:uncharacterized protein YggE|nr:SIMPL domain-containing protein [Blastocatellia bacterium]
MKKTRRILDGLLVLVALTAFNVRAAAQDMPDRNPRPSIRVTGEATIIARPDQAQIDVGVMTQAQNAQDAASQNAQKQEAVISALRKAMGAGADIKTVSYSLNPNYRYPEGGGQPTITGYTASNTVQVKTGDLTQVGKIIDLATQAGANNIQSLRFMLKDEQAARAQALREAAIKARAKADALASALGLKIQRVLFVEESGQVMPIPVYARAEMTAAAAQTPVEAGTIDVRAVVTLTLEVAQ